MTELIYAPAAMDAQAQALEVHIGGIVATTKLERQHEVDDLNNTINQLRSELAQAKANSQTDSQTIADLTNKLASKEAELAALKAAHQLEVTDLKAQHQRAIDQMNATVNSLRTEKTGLEEAIGILEQQKLSLSETIALRDANIAQLNSTITARNSLISQLEQRIAQLELGGGGITEEREKLVRGTYTPGPTTTGLTHPSKLTVVTGIQTFDCSQLTGDIVIRDKHYTSTVRFIGSSTYRITFINCKGSGKDNVSGTVTSVSAHNVGVRDIVWIDSELAFNYQGAGDPANVHHMKFLRCNIWGGIDAVGIWNAFDVNGVQNGPGVHDNAVEILDSWLHDLYLISPFPSQSSNDSHNDLIHIRGGSNVKILGSYLQAMYTQAKGASSTPPTWDNTDPAKPKLLGGNRRYPYLGAACAVQISDDYGPPRDIIIEYNVVEWGSVGINAATGGGGNIGSISYNRVGIGSFYDGSKDRFVIYTTGLSSRASTDRPANTFKFEGNVNMYTGAPVTTRHRGDY